MVRKGFYTHRLKCSITEMKTDHNLNIAKGYLEGLLWVAYDVK